MIDLTWALIIWLAVLIVIYVIAKAYYIRTRSAIVLAWVLATIVLLVIRPVGTIEFSALINANNLAISLYSLIVIITLIIIIVYVIGMTLTDREIQGVKGVKKTSWIF
jgi:energy-coupling factor transporter transmembrane protein EcfT